MWPLAESKVEGCIKIEGMEVVDWLGERMGVDLGKSHYCSDNHGNTDGGGNDSIHQMLSKITLITDLVN